MSAAAPQQGEHPSPHRDRVRLDLLLFALACGPFGWIVQLVADYGLASQACRPGDAPRLAPPVGGWGAQHLTLLGLNLACLALCLFGAGLGLSAWRRTHEEKAGHASELIEIGEGRTRFMAACAIIAALAFALATGFDTALPFFVPSCWRFAS